MTKLVYLNNVALSLCLLKNFFYKFVPFSGRFLPPAISQAIETFTHSVLNQMLIRDKKYSGTLLHQ
mgnify:CR=1 FL=1